MTSALVGLGREFRSIDYVHGEAEVEHAMLANPTTPGSRMLCPSQDVRGWIKNPDQIDAITPNLRALSGLIDSCPEPVSVLDVGCHGGFVYDWLKANCQSRFTYTGCDIVESVIDAAIDAHDDGETAFDVADVTSLDRHYKARSYDIVFCSRVLIHLPYFRANMARLYTVAKRSLLVVLKLGERDVVKIMVADETTIYSRQFSRDTVADVAGKLTKSWRVEGKDTGFQSLILEKGRRSKR